jgi:hypothetical protein
MKLTQKKLIWIGVAAGFLHGLMTRCLFGFDFAKDGVSHSIFSSAFTVMSWAFVFGAPLTMGFLSIWIAEAAGPVDWKTRVYLPWASSLAGIAATMVLGWEGLICVVMLIPVMMVLSTLGGLMAAAVRKLTRGRSQLKCAALVASLPYVLAPIESLKDHSKEIRQVHNSIEVAAAPEQVWQEIRSVPKIREQEHSTSWIHWIGFPRPEEAVLEGEGVGSVRMARFERGLLFVERVTEWQEPKRLAFSIRADTASIPPTTLDEHVTIGGPYFDVLSGVYEIEPMAEGKVRLHLSSSQRLSTHFNWYAALWTEAVMSELQSYILGIVKQRAETRACKQVGTSSGQRAGS